MAGPCLQLALNLGAELAMFCFGSTENMIILARRVENITFAVDSSVARMLCKGVIAPDM